MDDFSIGTISLLVSNILLSSYPILIKTYISDIDIITQLIIRCIVYIFLAVPFLIIGKETLGLFKYLIEPKFLFISFINLIHIYSSYKGFEYLNPGVALTTFYTYPIIQLFLSKFLIGTQFNYEILYNLLGSFIGLIVLNKDLFTKKEKFTSPLVKSDNKNRIVKGFLFIALAALTEAIISVFYKEVNLKNPFSSLYSLYAPGFIIYLLYVLINKNGQIKKIFSMNKSILKNIIWFNILIGGLGYTLRLFSLTKITISWFSSLLFTNSISVFILGWLLLGEKKKIHHILGRKIII